MLVFSPEQTTLYSPTRELVFSGIISIVNRYIVTVVKTGFRSVTFFLFCVCNSIPRTKCFKLSSQLPKRYLDKVLVIRLSNIDLLFNTWIVSNNQFPYLILKTMVNYYLCCFVQIVSNTVITPLIESCLFDSKRLNTLFILERLTISILLE